MLPLSNCFTGDSSSTVDVSEPFGLTHSLTIIQMMSVMITFSVKEWYDSCMKYVSKKTIGQTPINDHKNYYIIAKEV